MNDSSVVIWQEPPFFLLFLLFSPFPLLGSLPLPHSITRHTPALPHTSHSQHSLTRHTPTMPSLVLASLLGLLLPVAAIDYRQDTDIDAVPYTEFLPYSGLDAADWTPGQVPDLDSVVDLNDFQLAAKNTLSAIDYVWYRTHATDGITYRDNIRIWEKVRINGYSFRDVSNVSTRTSILGHQFDYPFFIAPAAFAGLAHPDAESNLVRAAGANNLLYVPSISATQSMEQIADAALPGQVMFHQEYNWADSYRLQSELAEMEQRGFRAVFLTVDNTGVDGVRSWYMRFRPDIGNAHAPGLTLDRLADLRSFTSLPIVPKGVKTAHDVKKCADLGFPAVYISNHGGRQVDGVPTAVEILLDVHRLYPEVFSQLEIYADGGVRRATHILTLLALGVRAVGLGRSPMFANLFGQPGVEKMIDLLGRELATTMALMGEPNIDGFRGNTSFVRDALALLSRATLHSLLTGARSLRRSTRAKSKSTTLAPRSTLTSTAALLLTRRPSPDAQPLLACRAVAVALPVHKGGRDLLIAWRMGRAGVLGVRCVIRSTEYYRFITGRSIRVEDECVRVRPGCFQGLGRNISFATTMLSRFLPNPTEIHLYTALRVLRYLIGVASQPPI